MTATAARQRPILMSGPMVRAILDGRKTQTRRVVRPQPEHVGAFMPLSTEIVGLTKHGGPIDSRGWVTCPYGGPGDLLWVRESIVTDSCGGLMGYVADDYQITERWERKKPSIHMPKWFCRLWLRVTDVRVERVQEITHADAIAEGVQPISEWNLGRDDVTPPREQFAQLWDSNSGKRPGCSWADNPYVWAITFERTEAAQ